MNTWAKFSGGFSLREVRSWPTSTLATDEAGEASLTLSSWCKLLGEDTDVGGGDEWDPSISFALPTGRWALEATGAVEEDTGGREGVYPA